MDTATIAGGQPLSGRTVTVTVSLPAILSGLIILCAGFVGVFALGILLGRGYNIEAHIPQLEKIMPKAGRAGDPSIAARAGPSSGQMRDSRPEAGLAPGKDAPPRAGEERAAERDARPAGAHDQTMRQEDLAYQDSLKPSAGRGAAQRRGGGKEEKSAPREKKTPAGGGAPQEKTAPAEDGSDRRELFNYVYQVAASRDAAASDKLAARLKAAGFRARTESSRDEDPAWHRTMVDFRGSPEGTEALRVQLKNQGFSRILLKSKTPAR